MRAEPGSAAWNLGLRAHPPADKWHRDAQGHSGVESVQQAEPDSVHLHLHPGDGSVHGAEVITVLHYAGNGKWSFEEDAYNPMNFLVMIQAYVQRCHELGTISEDAKVFAKNMNWQLA